MKDNTCFIGIDIAADDFTATILTQPNKPTILKEQIPNTIEGFLQFIQWLDNHHVTVKNTIICMENTGVYSDQIAYFLATKGYHVALEHPLKVKRAFDINKSSTDPINSKQIAEYAYRFTDELKFWKPLNDVVEQIKTLLATREQFVKQRTSNQNILKAFSRKHVKTPLAQKTIQTTIDTLSKNIKTIEKEIKKTINNNDHLKNHYLHLTAIPTVKLLLASHMLVLTNGFATPPQYKKIASYIGIVPRECQSGKSVYKKPHCQHFGPRTFRKLFKMAALSLRTHNPRFKQYFIRKTSEGKEPRVALKNIENKLLKIICAVINNNLPYIENYQSVNPLSIK